MAGKDLIQVNVAQDIGIRHNHVLLTAELQEVHGGVQALQLAPIGVDIGGGVGGQKLHAALAQLQAPLLTVADVVHEGLEIVPGNNAHMAHTGAAQVTQREVHQTVTAAEGDGGHGPLIGQISQTGVTAENKTHYFHCGFPPYSMSPGFSTVFSATTAPLAVTLIFFFSLGPKAPPTTALRSTLLFSPRMA